jgi:lipopolysaccharide/colanic/teichoic acid biosynthesis glycosyltransferase
MSRIEEFRGPERDFQLVVKRVLDIIIAAVALILLAPLFLLVAIAIKLDSGGAIFASQVQYCYDNRLIHVLKFRCTAIGSTGKAGVTRIDRLLSGRDLDRLPMLINVLRGDMSIVGPCWYVSPPLVPLSPELPDAPQRSKLKPGLICRAKLSSSHLERGTSRQIEDDICWVRRGVVTSHFVEWHGAPVKSVKTGFRHAVELAGLWGKVTPHTLRHTAATWLMQAGVPIWQAAGYLGMSAQMIERTYGHHHPDYMRGAAAAITTKQQQNISGQPKNVSLVVSLVEPENRSQRKQKT